MMVYWVAKCFLNSWQKCRRRRDNSSRESSSCCSDGMMVLCLSPFSQTQCKQAPSFPAASSSSSWLSSSGFFFKTHPSSQMGAEVPHAALFSFLLSFFLASLQLAIQSASVENLESQFMSTSHLEYTACAEEIIPQEPMRKIPVGSTAAWENPPTALAACNSCDAMFSCRQ